MLLYRRLRYGYAFCRIPLTQGKYAIVDPDDYRQLSKYKWYAAGRREGPYYAVRNVKNENGSKRRVLMHRQILKVPDDMFVDHIDRNSLDNRKVNLRPATPAQNIWNRAKNTNITHTSKYKGVSWNCCKKPWRVHIQFNHKLISLGSFDCETKAAKAYDRAAKRYHGEFAVLNFPERKRQISNIIPFIAGVILTYIAHLTVWPDQQTELMNAYQQLTDTFKLIDFCHPERSEGSRRWRFCRNVEVPFIPPRLRFFVPLRSAQNDMRGGSTQNDRSGGSTQNDRSGSSAQNDMRGGSAQNDMGEGSAQNDMMGSFTQNENRRRFTQTHPQVKRKKNKKIGPV